MTALILASILGAWGTAWSLQRDLIASQNKSNQIHESITQTLSSVSQAVAINSVTMTHNDADCDKAFQRAMAEIQRLYDTIEKYHGTHP